MPHGRRLLGIDAAKVVALYGVTVIHVFAGFPETSGVVRVREAFLLFAVPFFLLASYFLSLPKLRENLGRGYLRARVGRLLVPYFCWTVLLLALRTVLHLAAGRSEALRELYSDPLNLFAFGGVYSHLYFVPLLFTGECLCVLLVRLPGRPAERAWFRYLLLAAGIAVAAGDFARRWPHFPNDPTLTTPLRPFNTALYYATWNLPFLAAALVLSDPSRVRTRLERMGAAAGAVALLGFAGWVAAGAIGRPPTAWGSVSLSSLIASALLLVAAIGLSPLVPPNRLLANAGLCLFGIYLSHPLALEIGEAAMGRGPIPRPEIIRVPIQLGFALAVFLGTWAFVAATMRVPILGRLLYGVSPRRKDQTPAERSAPEGSNQAPSTQAAAT